MIVTQHDASRILQKYYGSDFKPRLTTKQQIGVRPLYDPQPMLAWQKLARGRDSAVRIGTVMEMRVGRPVLIEWNWSDVVNEGEDLVHFVRHVETQRWYTFKTPHGPHTEVENAEPWPTLETAAEIASQLTHDAGRGAYEAVTMMRYQLHEDIGGTETWHSAELYTTGLSEIRQAVIAGFRCGTPRWATIRSTVVYKLDRSGKPCETCR